MESARFTEYLAADAQRLRDAALVDVEAAVPSCPGWTVTDLLHHVAEVYLHKVECMRRGRSPEPWPPKVSAEEPIARFDRAYLELFTELSTRDPGELTYTWYDPDQLVGFWARRMAHETAVHRVDAQLAAAGSAGNTEVTVTPIDDELALDGIDEVLTIFLAWASTKWPKEFESALVDADGSDVLVTAGGEGGDERWLVRPTAKGVEVSRGEPDAAAPAPSGGNVARVSGDPSAVLLWLWGRGADDTVRLNGDHEAIERLRALLEKATQ